MRLVREGGGAADQGPEPELQPPSEVGVGCGSTGARTAIRCGSSPRAPAVRKGAPLTGFDGVGSSAALFAVSIVLEALPSATAALETTRPIECAEIAHAEPRSHSSIASQPGTAQLSGTGSTTLRAHSTREALPEADGVQRTDGGKQRSRHRVIFAPRQPLSGCHRSARMRLRSKNSHGCRDRDERVGAPLRCTVRGPHCAAPHPNLVPLRSSTSRSNRTSGVSVGTSTVAEVPLTRTVTVRGCSAPSIVVRGSWRGPSRWPPGAATARTEYDSPAAPREASTGCGGTWRRWAVDAGLRR